MCMCRSQPVLGSSPWVWPCTWTGPLSGPDSTDVSHLQLCEHRGVQAAGWRQTGSTSYLRWDAWCYYIKALFMNALTESVFLPLKESEKHQFNQLNLNQNLCRDHNLDPSQILNPHQTGAAGTWFLMLQPPSGETFTSLKMGETFLHILLLCYHLGLALKWGPVSLEKLEELLTMCNQWHRRPLQSYDLKKHERALTDKLTFPWLAHLLLAIVAASVVYAYEAEASGHMQWEHSQ